jgi:hypothetical protein
MTNVFMSNADHSFFEIVGPPARFTVEQVAVKLNFRVHDIPILVSKKHLKPLGNPPPSGVKYFASTEILRLASDPSWLAKATNIIYGYWEEQNAKKRSRATTGNLNSGIAALVP